MTARKYDDLAVRETIILAAIDRRIPEPRGAARRSGLEEVRDSRGSGCGPGLVGVFGR